MVASGRFCPDPGFRRQSHRTPPTTPAPTADRATERITNSLADRFWAKVDRRGLGDCWLWKGSRSDYGYTYLARCYGVARTTIRRIVTGEGWLEPEGCLPDDGCEVDVYDILDQADYEIARAERDGTDAYDPEPDHGCGCGHPDCGAC